MGVCKRVCGRVFEMRAYVYFMYMCKSALYQEGKGRGRLDSLSGMKTFSLQPDL